MSTNNLDILAQSGIQTDLIPTDQRETLESLSPEELSVLINVHTKIHASDDVVGQSAEAVVGGLLF